MQHSIPYNPIMLKWARERINYTEEDIAKKFPNKTIEDIKNWEEGRDSPTYVQLEKLAYEIYKKPLAIFFFPEPPDNININKSFRTIAEYELLDIEPKFKLLIDKAYSYQLNIKDLTNNINPSTNFLLNNLNFNYEDTTLDMVNSLRKYLDITIDEQKKWKSTVKALELWINKLENVGIFVFREAFKNDTYSGFCLYDNKIPIIYINNSKSKSRQIFTLFHELAHILFNTSGIDSKNYFDYFQGPEEIIERHCNQFAGEFLIPIESFKNDIKNLKLNDVNFEKLSKLYSVSKEAILRKFLNLQLITNSYYEEKSEQWNHEYLEIQKKKKQNGGPKPHHKANIYLSNTYKDIVIQDYLNKKLSIEQASNYFNIQSKYLNPLITYYFRKEIIQ